jgi:hypothetical protein
MPNKQNQSQSDLEDDIKAPSMGQPGKETGVDEEESTTETSSGLEDDDEGAESRDEETPTRTGEELEDEAENDAGYDSGAKGQPR